MAFSAENAENAPKTSINPGKKTIILFKKQRITENINKITTKSYAFFSLVTIHFIESGYFGKKIVFMPSRNRFNEALAAYDNLKAIIR